MSLRAVHGNRVEALLDAMLGVLPAADPFAPSTIVVGSHLVARWLTREIALTRGIAAGLELVTFDAFITQTWAGDEAARAANLVALDKRQLAAAIASVVADEAIVRRLPAVAAYLAAAPAPGDRAGPRRVQLAEHVATLAWNYALTRPDWMPALLSGHVPSELEGNANARWQAALIGEAMAKAGCDRKQCAPVPTLPWARRRAGLPTPRRTPITVFGVSYLLRSQLEALSDLATTSDVTVYLLDPCAELWDDVSGRARAKTSVDPLPLALWGRAVRDTLGALVERTGGDLEAAFVEAAPRDAREELLADVLNRRLSNVVSAETDARATSATGVRVLACPDARRELEIVAAEIRTRLDADTTLHARDIGVWIASQDERYLAQAPAAFEAVGVPWHLIDAPIDDRGRIGEAVLALLELPTSAMTRGDLLRVMTHPAVLAGHPHVSAEDWVRWTEKLGIVHGADHDAHEDTYLADHPGHFHWDQGVRRLALGAFMTGARASKRGAVRIAGLDVAPEEVRPEQHASAATYALLVRSLCADSAWLDAHEATLGEWANIFVGLVDAYLARPTDEASRDVERVRSMLAGIAHVDLDGRKVGFREAREHAMRRVVRARANRGEPLAAGVMVAPLGAMRALPFRVAFVLGLDEGTFPAGDQPSPLDLRVESRAGDVSPRDRDRHAFLEVLLGARDALYLSYVAVEAKSGQALGPSSVILELGDALAPYLGAPSSRAALDRLTTRYPLHRFASDIALPPAVARERWAVRVRDALRAHLRAKGYPVPDENGMLPLLDQPLLAELRAALGISETPASAPSASKSTPPESSVVIRGASEPVPSRALSSVSRIESERAPSSSPAHSDGAGESAPSRSLSIVSDRAGQSELGPLLSIVGDGAGAAEDASAAVATGAAEANLAGDVPTVRTRSITIANVRAFLEAPVQAWAQAVLGLDELPDEAVIDHSDEPFHVDRPARAVLLREVLAEQLGVGAHNGTLPLEPEVDAAKRYDAVVRDLELRGQFPVGVFGDAARAVDLRVLAEWRAKLGPVAVGAATRLAFGRSSSPSAELLPALEIELSGSRTVRLVGQTDVLLRDGDRYRSVIPLLGKADKRSRYHLRGALDHVVLAAAGLANAGHAHVLLDPEGTVRKVEHDPWTRDEARDYLGALIGELLDAPHGYLLPFDHLVHALAGTKPGRQYGPETTTLGYGPIDRLDGLAPPPDAAAIAQRRLGPLVARMHGDHSLGGDS